MIHPCEQESHDASLLRPPTTAAQWFELHSYCFERQFKLSPSKMEIKIDIIHSSVLTVGKLPQKSVIRQVYFFLICCIEAMTTFCLSVQHMLIIINFYRISLRRHCKKTEQINCANTEHLLDLANCLSLYLKQSALLTEAPTE